MVDMLNILSAGHALADVGGGFWMPPQISKTAADVDWLFFFILWICVFFFVLVLVLLVVFAWKYRYREGQVPLDAPKHNTALELTWTFIPTLIVVVIFYYGFKGYMRMTVVPPDAYEVDVDARMWSYTFRYPNGSVDEDLHVPVNTPIELVMTSDDVIHGFFMPVFRLKHDIVPGRYNKIWFQADQIGKYDIFCTQYCGQDHSAMRRKVYVTTAGDFAEWLKKASGEGLSPAERGKRDWRNFGCYQCHSIDNSATGKAPTWTDVYGSTVTFTNWTPQVADENYLHYMIMVNPNQFPQKQIPGFAPVMPATQGLVSEPDSKDLIAFIKTLSRNYHPQGAAAATQPATAPAK